MLKKIIHFIKYHNAFTIGLALVLFVTAGAFASEDVRDAVIGEKVENAQGIDNSQLLAADLDNFDFLIIIKDVQEDANNYYLGYEYQTLAIQENAWRGVLKNNSLTVSKARLRDRDLGLYAQEELGENLDRELKYLKEVQAIERANGVTQLTVSTNYTGLVGLVLDIKDKIFPEYEPVVKQLEITGNSTEINRNLSSSGNEFPQISTNFNEFQSQCVNGENRPCSSQIGACRIGVEICTDGVWGDCIGAVFPTEEIKDEVDNDCDGQIDEGLIPGSPTSETLNQEVGLPDISSSTESMGGDAGGDETGSPAGDPVSTTTDAGDSVPSTEPSTSTEQTTTSTSSGQATSTAP